MYVNAQTCGLDFDKKRIAANAALLDAQAEMLDNFDPIPNSRREVRDGDFVHETVIRRDECNNPGATCMRVNDVGRRLGLFPAV